MAQATDDQSDNTIVEHTSEIPFVSVLMSFTPDQQKSLLALIQHVPQSSQPNVNHLHTNPPAPSGTPSHPYIFSNENAWVLDIGATYLMYHSSVMLSNLMEIKVIIIKLPNGAYAKTFHSSTIYFNRYFFLCNVLYILEFHTNLISIHRLANALNSIVYFDSSKYLIQGNHTLRSLVQLS